MEGLCGEPVILRHSCETVTTGVAILAADLNHAFQNGLLVFDFPWRGQRGGRRQAAGWRRLCAAQRLILPRVWIIQHRQANAAQAAFFLFEVRLAGGALWLSPPECRAMTPPTAAKSSAASNSGSTAWAPHLHLKLLYRRGQRRRSGGMNLKAASPYRGEPGIRLRAAKNSRRRGLAGSSPEPAVAVFGDAAAYR